MVIADFIHLKVRSAYSLTEGANKVDAVVALAKAQAMPAVAVTDRNNLFGALEFAQYAANAGIQPIMGCDLGLRREEEGGIATATKLPSVDWLTLLVQNEQGYRNIRRALANHYTVSAQDPDLQIVEADLNGSRRLQIVHRVHNGVLLDKLRCERVLLHVARLWGYRVKLLEIDIATGKTLREHESLPMP